VGGVADSPAPGVRHTHEVDVAIIGSGFSGLGAAIRLKRAGIDDFLVFERADDVGGTWRDNHYGRNTTLWPGWTFRFRQRTQRFDPEAYVLSDGTATSEPQTTGGLEQATDVPSEGDVASRPAG
jgi:glycine/D-amino acid oxidase-like deaminating enzyme